MNIIDDYEYGIPVKDILRHYKITSLELYDTLKAHKDRSRTTVKTPLRTLKIIAKLFDKDATMEKIGEEFNVTRQRVQQIYSMAKEADIPGLPIR